MKMFTQRDFYKHHQMGRFTVCRRTNPSEHTSNSQDFTALLDRKLSVRYVIVAPADTARIPVSL